MSRSNNLGLSIAIALSILSASALSGERSNEALSFLGALQVNSLPFATKENQLAETSRPASTDRNPEVLNWIKPVRVMVDPDMGLEARRQAFIARVVADLSSKNPKDKLVLALKGDTQ